MGKYALARLPVGVLYKWSLFQLADFFNWKWAKNLNIFIVLFLALHSKILENTEKKKAPYPKHLHSKQISTVTLTFFSHPGKVQKGTNFKRQGEYGPLSQS